MSTLTARTVIFVDVENGCHRYTSGVRLLSSDVLVFLVVAKSYGLGQADGDKLKQLQPVLEAMEGSTTASASSSTTTSSSYTYRSTNSASPLTPLSDRVFLVRAASDVTEAADICLQRFMTFALKYFYANRSFSGDYCSYSERAPSRFFAAAAADAFKIESCSANPLSSSELASTKVELSDSSDNALVVAAVADKRYTALILEMRALNDALRSTEYYSSIRMINSSRIVWDSSSSLCTPLSVDSTFTVRPFSNSTAASVFQLPACACRIVFATDEQCRQHCADRHPQCSSCKCVYGSAKLFAAECGTSERKLCLHRACTGAGGYCCYSKSTTYCARALKSHYDAEHKVNDEQEAKRAADREEQQRQMLLAQQQQQLAQAAREQPYRALCCDHPGCKKSFDYRVDRCGSVVAFKTAAAKQAHMKACKMKA